MYRALVYMKHTDKFTSPKHRLLVFQVKTNTAHDQGLLGSRCYNFRHLQHSCIGRGAALLTCLEDITQNYPSDSIKLAFMKYVLLFYFYHSKSYNLKTRCIQPLRKFVCQLQEKRLSYLVHYMESGIVLETGPQEKLYPPTDVSISLQCRPQLLLVKFENLVHSTFRNKNSTLEMDVSHLGVLHLQQ